MNLPVEFLRNIEKELGKTESDKLVSTLTGSDSVTSIRLNSRKSSCTVVNNIKSAFVPWCEYGHYLDVRPSFTFDPLFHAGLYYVQEASSMFLHQVLKQYVHQPVRMLDLCAAPGGKSTLALQNLPDNSLLVANEVDRSRSYILAENLIKWGNGGILVTNEIPEHFSRYQHFFDVLLTDVPCSGEGMFRKDAQAVEEWSEKNVEMCTARQRAILKDAWACLKPGGLLIYSTCTYNIHEDEENVHWIAQELGAESLPVKIQDEWHITGNLANLPEHIYHFFPHKTEGEGFFLAVLRKSEDSDTILCSSEVSSGRLINKKKSVRKSSMRKKDRTNSASALHMPDEVKNWLRDDSDFVFHVYEEKIVAIPAALDDDVRLLKEGLQFLQEGITVAVKKGKNWAPAHSLAMSQHLNASAFPAFDVSLEKAWAYLRGESFPLPPNVPVGFVLITYCGYPLGFVKNIGNRSNNLYPQNWKIRSSHFPSAEETCSIIS